MKIPGTARTSRRVLEMEVVGRWKREKLRRWRDGIKEG